MGLIRKLTNKIVFFDTAPLIYYIEENQKYHDILRHSSSIELFDLDADISIAAARYRARYGLRTPDAIQVATAIDVSADFFLTNDLKFRNVNEIEVLILDEII